MHKRHRAGHRPARCLPYIDFYQDFRPRVDGDKENINDDIEFEVELIRQVEINIDYILILVARYGKQGVRCEISSQNKLRG